MWRDLATCVMWEFYVLSASKARAKTYGRINYSVCYGDDDNRKTNIKRENGSNVKEALNRRIRHEWIVVNLLDCLYGKVSH